MGLIALLILVAYWNQIQKDKVKKQIDERKKAQDNAGAYRSLYAEEKIKSEWELVD